LKQSFIVTQTNVLARTRRDRLLLLTHLDRRLPTPRRATPARQASHGGSGIAKARQGAWSRGGSGPRFRSRVIGSWRRRRPVGRRRAEARRAPPLPGLRGPGGGGGRAPGARGSLFAALGSLVRVALPAAAAVAMVLLVVCGCCVAQRSDGGEDRTGRRWRASAATSTPTDQW